MLYLEYNSASYKTPFYIFGGRRGSKNALVVYLLTIYSHLRVSVISVDHREVIIQGGSNMNGTIFL
jgi:hypothetical protein